MTAGAPRRRLPDSLHIHECIGLVYGLSESRVCREGERIDEEEGFCGDDARENACDGERKDVGVGKGRRRDATRAEVRHSYGERSENYCSFLIETMSQSLLSV